MILMAKMNLNLRFHFFFFDCDNDGHCYGEGGGGGGGVIDDGQAVEQKTHHDSCSYGFFSWGITEEYRFSA
jgi:hypothetical protein